MKPVVATMFCNGRQIFDYLVEIQAAISTRYQRGMPFSWTMMSQMFDVIRHCLCLQNYFLVIFCSFGTNMSREPIRREERLFAGKCLMSNYALIYNIHGIMWISKVIWLHISFGTIKFINTNGNNYVVRKKFLVQKNCFVS